MNPVNMNPVTIIVWTPSTSWDASSHTHTVPVQHDITSAILIIYPILIIDPIQRKPRRKQSFTQSRICFPRAPVCALTGD